MRVLTFKEGLLSAAAHDLELEAGRFEVELDEAAGTVSARFDAAALRVLHATVSGIASPGSLSEQDRRDIERNLARDVLETKRFPEIRFEGRAEGGTVRGTLSLHGVAKELSFPFREQAGMLTAEVTLHQPDFGVKPFRALLGALRVKPDVVVKVALPKA